MSTVREQIIERLQALQPTLLEVVDESAAHAGHAGALQHAAKTGAAEGTHFELRIQSATFAGKPLIARHRAVYDLLADLMRTRIHALKIEAIC
jgi:BolA family transcriptional regulator, general stress-responsive regulator